MNDGNCEKVVVRKVSIGLVGRNWGKNVKGGGVEQGQPVLLGAVYGEDVVLKVEGASVSSRPATQRLQPRENVLCLFRRKLTPQIGLR